jgi:hypothetical protein
MRDRHLHGPPGALLFGLLVCCVTVTGDDGGWSRAERIEDQGDPPTGAQVALDASGAAVVVWFWGGFADGTIRSRHHTPDAGWGPIEQIDSNETDAFYPALAVDPNGNAVSVWQQAGETNRGIWANRYTAGSGWGTAVRVDVEEGDRSGPQVAIDASGNAIAVWNQSDGARENIWANRSSPDGSWGVAQLIETENLGHASSPRVAMDPDGNATAVWHQSDGERASIWANRYTPSSGWGVADTIEKNDEGEARLPYVAMDPDGNAMVVWHQSDGTRFNIWASRYDGTWGTPQLIDSDDTGDADTAEVGLDADGRATAVWKQFDGISVGIWADRYVPGSGWGIAVRIEENDFGDALRPRLAVSANGDAVAVWLQSDGSRLNVWSNAYTPSERWGRALPIELSSGEGEQGEEPAVAMDPNGHAMAVWSTIVRIPDSPEAGSIWAARRE